MSIRRRSLLAAPAAAALAGPAVAQAPSVLKFVPQANLTSLDPIWTTANVTRNHAWMVWDVLYGMDEGFQPQPQMAAGHVVEDDGRRITITLRDNLRFHDGEAVRAEDCVVSLRRWMKRNPNGQVLEPLIEELVALDDKRLVFRLKRPFPRLIASLASPCNPAAFIMPARIAATDPFQQIKEVVGSGPWRFLPGEYNSGSFMAYARNAAYQPVASGVTSLTAGPKIAHFDRIEWHIIVDAATASAALQNGEIDWYEQPPPEIQQMFRRNRQIALSPIDRLKNPAILRFNHLQPPFNDKRMRQALLPAIVQEDYMTAIVGPDAALWSAMGTFTPDTPLANDVGMAALTGPRSIPRAKALLKEAGYTNQTIRLIGPTDILAPAAMTQVAADMFRKLDVNLDFLLTDWGSVIQRRTSKEPLEKGGWSLFPAGYPAAEYRDPLFATNIRGNGAGAWFGWPEDKAIEAMRSTWMDSTDEAERKRLDADIQRRAFETVPFIPLGQYMPPAAWRKSLSGLLKGPVPVFWNVAKA